MCSYSFRLFCLKNCSVGLAAPHSSWKTFQETLLQGGNLWWWSCGDRAIIPDFERLQEHSCAICSVGRRCLVTQIIFSFHNDIATSPYKPIKKVLVQLISTFKAGEVQCKLKNWSCLYLNGRLTFPDHIQRSISLVLCPIFKWNLSKSCSLHLSTPTRTKYIKKSFQNMPSQFKAAFIFML